MKKGKTVGEEQQSFNTHQMLSDVEGQWFLI